MKTTIALVVGWQVPAAWLPERVSSPVAAVAALTSVQTGFAAGLAGTPMILPGAAHSVSIVPLARFPAADAPVQDR